MTEGRIVEQGPTEQIFTTPERRVHPQAAGQHAEHRGRAGARVGPRRVSGRVLADASLDVAALRAGLGGAARQGRGGRRRAGRRRRRRARHVGAHGRRGRARSALPALRIVLTPSVGFDHIDLDAIRRRGGVWACHVPDYCVEEMADSALAMALALMRGVVELDRTVRAGGWDAVAAGRLRRIRGTRLGVIGFGRIGAALAVRARALGFEVWGSRPGAAGCCTRGRGRTPGRARRAARLVRRGLAARAAHAGHRGPDRCSRDRAHAARRADRQHRPRRAARHRRGARGAGRRAPGRRRARRAGRRAARSRAPGAAGAQPDRHAALGLPERRGGGRAVPARGGGGARGRRGTRARRRARERHERRAAAQHPPGHGRPDGRRRARRRAGARRPRRGRRQLRCRLLPVAAVLAVARLDAHRAAAVADGRLRQRRRDARLAADRRPPPARRRLRDDARRQDALRRARPAPRLRGAPDARRLSRRAGVDAGLARRAGRAAALVPHDGQRARARGGARVDAGRLRRRGRLPRHAGAVRPRPAARRRAVLPRRLLHPPARPVGGPAALLGPLRRGGDPAARRRADPARTRPTRTAAGCGR